MRRIILSGLMVALFAGCASGPSRVIRNETLQRYLSYAGQPIDHFSTLNGISSWESVSDDYVVLRTSINRAYLVKVLKTCPDLRFANSIRVVSTLPGSVHRLDKIVVGRDSCPIREIRQIAVRQMKADRAASQH